tara:strand:+ start:737 stop:958 length:222 start_codon:yes stop_codon:yes gene_type:complete
MDESFVLSIVSLVLYFSCVVWVYWGKTISKVYFKLKDKLFSIKTAVIVPQAIITTKSCNSIAVEVMVHEAHAI